MLLGFNFSKLVFFVNSRFCVLLKCLSFCNTQARVVNLIPAILCDDVGVTQARGC